MTAKAAVKTVSNAFPGAESSILAHREARSADEATAEERPGKH